MKNIEEEVIELIANVAEVDKESISLSSDLVLDVELESLDIVTLIAEFEKKYQVKIHDKDIKSLQTVEDIVNYIKDYE